MSVAAADPSEITSRRGRIAQRESARFTRERSLVQSQLRPSRATGRRFLWPGATGRRNRLGSLTAHRSPGPCDQHCPFRRCTASDPPETREASGLNPPVSISRPRPAAPYGQARLAFRSPPDTAERTSLSGVVRKYCLLRRSTLSGAPRTREAIRFCSEFPRSVTSFGRARLALRSPPAENARGTEFEPAWL